MPGSLAHAVPSACSLSNKSVRQYVWALALDGFIWSHRREHLTLSQVLSLSQSLWSVFGLITKLKLKSLILAQIERWRHA